MGIIDTASKRYLAIGKIFADAFNYLIYEGEQIIQADKLRPVDTSEIAIPYGNGAKAPIQKYRDTMKIWAAMEDGEAVYVLLGFEAQTKIHYAMPVRDMLYDAINYAGQVDEARRSYRKKEDEGELIFEKDQIKIKLTSEEFLSGFRKEDKLIPIVTAIVFFGPEEWDAPTSIHEMINVPDERLLRVIPNYFINLIVPARMEDADFEKFHTDFGFAMKVIKHQTDDTIEIIKGTKNRKIDRDTAEFLNTVVKLELVYQEPAEEVEVDMCKAMEDYTKKMKILGAVEMLRDLGMDNQSIIEKIMDKFNLTQSAAEEYVLPKAV